MSSPADLEAPADGRRNADGPDAVDDRGFVRIVTADFDMGAWFDARTAPQDTDSDTNPDRP